MHITKNTTDMNAHPSAPVLAGGGRLPVAARTSGSLSRLAQAARALTCEALEFEATQQCGVLPVYQAVPPALPAPAKRAAWRSLKTHLSSVHIIKNTSDRSAQH